MAGITNLEPQAYGLITFITTFGNIDIELFTKQCPKTTRNFVQFCLDGYYTGASFERIEKDFIAIGGTSPQCDVQLESKSPDEFHPRLRFTRRGLLATANEGKNQNGPKFFFSLGATPELQNRHTIFGRAKGNSVYTLVELNECQVDDDYKPYSEQKIEEVKIIDNPFQDLEPRLKITRDEVDQSEQSSEKDYYDPLLKPRQDSNKTKKLSFYYEDDDESDCDDKKLVSDKSSSQIEHHKSESLHAQDNSVDKKIDSTLLTTPSGDTSEIDLEKTGEEDVSSVEERARRLQEIKAQIEAIKKQMENSVTKEKSSRRGIKDNDAFPKTKLTSPINESEPDQAPERGKSRQRDTIDLVNNFKKKLKQASASDRISPKRRSDKVETSPNEIDELDMVDGDSWLNHKFEPIDTTEQDHTYSPDHSHNNIHNSTPRRHESTHHKHTRHRNHYEDSTRSHKSRRH